MTRALKNLMGRFAKNPYYVEYETLLKELHRLIAAGEGDSDEADAVRDAMDLPERELTGEELDRLDGLSADLYMLQDDEIYEPHDPAEDPAERDPGCLRQAAEEAWNQGDAERMLALLRKGPAYAQAETAYLRAKAYEELGHLDTAFRFIDYAARLDPTNTDYQRLATGLRTRLGRMDEGVEAKPSSRGS